jgi:hypothetical protein
MKEIQPVEIAEVAAATSVIIDVLRHFATPRPARGNVLITAVLLNVVTQYSAELGDSRDAFLILLARAIARLRNVD